MKEPDFKKLAIETPFNPSDIESTYNTLRILGVNESNIEGLLNTLMKLAITSKETLSLIVGQYCNTNKARPYGSIGAPIVFPERIIFFCDCNAKFDSLRSLVSHASDCVAVNNGYPVREQMISLIEGIVKNDPFLPLVAPDPFQALVRQLAVYEFMRAQGREPKDTDSLRDMLSHSWENSKMPEGLEYPEDSESSFKEKIIEVIDWYQ